jgi:hypothetical protein
MPIFQELNPQKIITNNRRETMKKTMVIYFDDMIQVLPAVYIPKDNYYGEKLTTASKIALAYEQWKNNEVKK